MARRALGSFFAWPQSTVSSRGDGVRQREIAKCLGSEAGRIERLRELAVLTLGKRSAHPPQLSRLQNGNAAAPPQCSPVVTRRTQGAGGKGCTEGGVLGMKLSSSGALPPGQLCLQLLNELEEAVVG